MSVPSEDIEELFHQAGLLESDDDRRKFLRELEAVSPERATAVRRLLAVQENADHLFAPLSAAPGPAATLGSADPQGIDEIGSLSLRGSSAPLQKDDCVGPYKLLEPIGEGGMGIVYLAQQLNPVRRKVALKIIKPGMDSRQVVARFEAERQALAMMEHPNIATVLDAGTTDGGLPFFVMELVRGIPITDYCDLANEPTHQRLELFCDACGAIQHAHNKGVIHRDIKPSNVLVTEHDGTPVVKVIDFGVAKALTDTLTNKTLFTGVFQTIGTPLYMSPEQASLSNLDVDTRSDVYSLGVLLYELVAGKLPIDREAAKELSFEQLRERICDTEPPRPSKRISALNEGRESIAKRRGLRPDSHHRRLRGELDWIVMKAIERDRSRRYQSAAELAADVNRHLNGEAVLACPPSWAYRFGKFAKRYRASLISACLLLTAIMGGAAVSVQQAIKARRAEAYALQNERKAEQNADELLELLYAQDMQSAAKHYLAGDHKRLNGILNRYASGPAADLRGFEWQLFRSLQPPAMRVLYEGNDRINDIVQTDSGELLFADSLGRVIGMDPNTGEILSQWSTDHQDLHDLEWFPPHDLLTCGTDGAVVHHRLGAMDDGNLRKSVVQRFDIGGRALLALAVDPVARTAWAAGDGGLIHQLDLRTGTSETFARDDSVRFVRDLEYSPRLGLFAAEDFHVVWYPIEPTDRDGAVVSASELLSRSTLAEDMSDIRDLEISEPTRSVVAGQLLGLVSRLHCDERISDLPSLKVDETRMVTSDVHSVAAGRDGGWLVAGDSTGHLHFFLEIDGTHSVGMSMASPRSRPAQVCRPHRDKVLKVLFLQQSDQEGVVSADQVRRQTAVASVGRDGRVVVSQPFSQNPIQFLPASRYDDRQHVATELVRQWSKLALDTEPPPEVQLDEGQPTRERDAIVAWSHARAANETFYLINETVLVNDRGLVSWEAKAGEVAVRLAVSDDAANLAICVENKSSRRHRVEIYRIGQRTPLYQLPSGATADLAFSLDNDLLAYVFNDDVRIVDMSTGKIACELRAHKNSIRDIEFAPDGRTLASVSNDRRLILWDPHAGRPLWSQVAHGNRALAVAFHPRLSTLATAGSDAIVRFWTTRDLIAGDEARLVGEFPLDTALPRHLKFSADGDALHILHPQRGISTLRTR